MYVHSKCGVFYLHVHVYDFEMEQNSTECKHLHVHVCSCVVINLIHVDMVECILCLQDGRSALHMAIKGGHTKTVRVLLQRGVDPNQCANDVSDMI